MIGDRFCLKQCILALFLGFIILSCPTNPGLVSSRPQKTDELKRGKLLNDARYKIDFDTSQITSRLEIPRGKWGKTDYLEPLTKDYSHFGDGGAAQAIFRGSIKVNSVTDLHTGKIVFKAVPK